MAVDRLKHTENLSIPDIVKELRDQRMHAVQNDQVSSIITNLFNKNNNIYHYYLYSSSLFAHLAHFLICSNSGGFSLSKNIRKCVIVRKY